MDEGLAQVASIDAELLAYFDKTLADETLVEWVVEEDGEIVATAGLVYMPFPPTYANPVGARGYVTNMYTTPRHRGRGIASCLLVKLLDDARARGVRKVLLCASEMGKPVYLRCGFRENGGWMELDL
ncbi:MAG: GNAT family N-acetyltransferase [Coriobacteriales bacterium]|nr:GNAT family N-acetyltransferase [Coriobacteriales bacterium]